MTKTIEQSLDALVCRFLQQYAVNEALPRCEYDPDWPSEAVVRIHLNDECDWSPVKQMPKSSFEQMEKGLGIDIDQQLKSYYSRYWSANIDCEIDRGGLQLLLVWNPDDFIRLQENLIAHVLMKRRLKQRETLFFAVTDEEDWIISVLNDTGEVVLEQVGLEPKEILAPDLATFLDMLEPKAD